MFDNTLRSVQGQSTTLGVPFEDQESESLYYSWDFNAQVDTDGDGTVDNDEDAVGPTVQHTFSESGVYRVICRVQNDEGLVSDVEILVTVTDAESGDGIGLSDLLMALGALSLLLVFSFMAYLRIASNRRVAALLADSETEAEEDQTVVREPSAEEQKAMWGGSGGTLSNTQPMAIGDIASGMSGASAPDSEASPLEISEEEFAELLSQPSQSDPSDSLAADLLSAFEDEDDAHLRFWKALWNTHSQRNRKNEKGPRQGIIQNNLINHKITSRKRPKNKKKTEQSGRIVLSATRCSK